MVPSSRPIDGRHVGGLFESPSGAFEAGAGLWARFRGLDELLVTYQSLWRPQPFKDPRPSWSAAFPAYSDALLNLDSKCLAVLQQDPMALLGWASSYIPALGDVAALESRLQAGADNTVLPVSPHQSWGIPGRKMAQIQTFATAVIAQVEHSPYPHWLEWCAGKGHLGRLLAEASQRPCLSVEWQADLVLQGLGLAQRAKVAQTFRQADVLAPLPAEYFQEAACVALHACGDLHLSLMQQAQTAGAKALAIVPCCFHKTQAAVRTAWCGDSALQLTGDDLRLAVTEHVTASAREKATSDRLRLARHGFVILRDRVEGGAYRSFKPIPGAMAGASFEGLVRYLAQREGVGFPTDLDFAALYQSACERDERVARIELGRHAFRRALELWLVFDLALWLAQRGWQTQVRAFCSRRLTPRNLLIQALR